MPTRSTRSSAPPLPRSSAPSLLRFAAPTLLLAYLGFVSLGLPDALLGVAWPSIRSTFGLSQAALGAVLVAGSTGYFLSSFSTGALLRRLGVGGLLAGSTLLVALALAGYASAPLWLLFVGCAALAGLGSGAIDAGLNAHAASHFSARHMNWLHACWGLGATLGPLLMTAVLQRGLVWRWGYALVAIALLSMSAAFALTRRRWAGGEGDSAERTVPVRLEVALRQPLVWLQILLFFLYTGTEVVAGQWSFTLLTEGRGVALATAGTWVGLYWGSLTAGRVLFGALVERIGTVRLLRASLAGALLGALLVALRLHPWADAAGLALLGLSLAPIFPCLMSETPRRLGAGVAAHAVGFQVSAAVIGGAALPSLTGLLVQRSSLEAVGGMLVALALALALLHETVVRRTT